MGHSWREMDPSGAAEHDRHINRLLVLRSKLENMPLSSFTAGDLDALSRVMVIGNRAHVREEDFTRLEKRIQENS